MTVIGEQRGAVQEPRRLRAGSTEIVLDRPLVLGILNVTPDSFSDGGNFFSPGTALAHAAEMIAEGADIIDIGGESTRPGAIPIEAADESHRVIPVIAEMRKRWPHQLISIDTVKAGVAERALEAGADIINDVSAMRLDPEMPLLAAKSQAGVVLMHSRGTVADMATYDHAQYRDVVHEVIDELNSQLLLAEDAGVDRKNVVIDPGFGFAKKSEHSMRLLRELERFASLDVPIMAGVSRKRFVREAMGDHEAASSSDERDAATAAVNVMALERGASIFRVHNVAVNRKALDTAWSLLTTD